MRRHCSHFETGLAVGAGLIVTMAPAAAPAEVGTVRVASGLSRPAFVTAPPGDTERVFIVEQRSGTTGRVRILRNGGLLATPFLNVNNVTTGNEQGLLGLAFHPDYAANRKFYVNYTTSGGGAAGRTVIAEYTASAVNPDVADAASTRIILRIDQPDSNHNGGWMAFGPHDGYLYIASGDGGGGGDTGTGHTAGMGNAQDITSNLLGKILRIDVNGDDFPDENRNYAIPAGNPFADPPDEPPVAGDDEIWAYGLRNPWRCSFDRLTGDLIIADVGQNIWEEINYQPAGDEGGANYGWRRKEGAHCFNPSSGCETGALVDPIYEYGHDHNNGNAFSCGEPPVRPTGCSVTGGYVYRGAIPSLAGRYLFGDYCASWIMSFEISDGAASGCRMHTDEFRPGGGLNISSISSFGEDAAGELYICDLNGGEVFKIVGDADEDGVLDHLDLCPDTLPGVSVDAAGCPDPPVPGDADRDGDVDALDAAAFVACASGPEIPLVGPCADHDHDGDGDVDQSDFATFQVCYSGSGQLAEADCAVNAPQ